MDVFLANEQELSFDEVKLTALARHALVEEEVGHEAELSLLFVSPDHIQRLNKRFAGDDHATDVLAFPMMEDDDQGSLMLGDVVICPEVADKHARELGHSLADELEALVVHGTLHLLGYDHHKDEEKTQMDRRSQEILTTFTAAPPR